MGVLGTGGAGVAGIAVSDYGVAGSFTGDVDVTGNLEVDGTINATAFTGDGSGLTHLTQSIYYTAGTMLELIGYEFSHADTSYIGNLDNSGGTVVQDLNIDSAGHLTGGAS
jgi:hypothetical protein